jgi:ribosomal protein S27AE
MPTKKNPQRRNFWEKNLWEIHGEGTTRGQPECTRCTQEISRHQKQRTWGDTETNKGT